MTTALHPTATTREGGAPPRVVGRGRRVPAPLVVGALVALCLVVLPIAYLLVRAVGDGWGAAWATIGRGRTLELVGSSLGLAVAVTAACLVVGIGAAWLVTRTDVPGRGLWQVGMALPLALPSYVAAWAWVGLWPELRDATGAFLVLTTISVPYVYLPVAAALRQADPAVEEVARSLGHGPLRVFASVTLRQTRIAALGGGLLVGLYVLSDFGAVTITNYPSLTQAIYQSYRGSFDRTPAAALGVVLLVLTLVVIAVAARLGGRAGQAPVGSGVPRRPRTVELGGWRWPAALALTGWLALTFAAPVWHLVTRFLQGRSRADWGEYLEALTATLSVSALSALAVVVVALPVAILAARHPGRLARATSGVAYLGHALPGVVVGLALVFFGIRFAAPIYQRTPLLVLAYVVLFLSLALGAIQQAVAQAPPTLDDVARSLGRTQLGAWRSVTLRLAAPGLGAAATLVFLVVAKELPATLFLRPIGMDTLATQLWAHTESGAYAAAAPYAATIVLLAALPAALLAGRRLGRTS